MAATERWIASFAAGIALPAETIDVSGLPVEDRWAIGKRIAVSSMRCAAPVIPP
jgi:hypothetical protein